MAAEDGSVDSWPRPIPVSERLPEDYTPILWFCAGEWWAGHSDSGVFFSHVHHGTQHCETVESGVTHWLPLPPPPE